MARATAVASVILLGSLTFLFGADSSNRHRSVDLAVVRKSSENRPALGTTPLTTPERISAPLASSINSKMDHASMQEATNLMRPSAPTFIENRGQFDQRVKFQVRSSGPTLWLTGQEIVFDLLRTKPGESATPTEESTRLPHIGSRQSPTPAIGAMERLVIAEEFVGASDDGVVEAEDQQPGIYNYFKGSDPEKWVTHVHGYSRVIYRNLWSGIDLNVHRNGPNLEQEFVVRAGGDLSRVQVAYRGIERLRLGEDGSLVVRSAFGEFRESAPRIYQEIADKRVPVEGRFKLIGETAYTFEVDAYRTEYALVIDPTLLYSTYAGGPSADQAIGVAADGSGNAYITGQTSFATFPTTNPPSAPTCLQSGCSSIFVLKLDGTGKLVYGTFLSSSGGYDTPQGIAINSAGEAYVTGLALSGFPTTPNAYQTSCSTSAFLTKISAAGNSLVYSTCLGSGGARSAVATDNTGKAYVAGGAVNIPTTSGAYQNVNHGSTYLAVGNAFLVVLDPSLSGSSSLLYGSYLGGSVRDTGYGVAVDSYGNAFVTGLTASNDFPTTVGAYQRVNKSATTSNAFIAKFNPRLVGINSLIYSTYLGGGGGAYPWGDTAYGIAVDPLGSAYIAGTTSSIDFPTTASAFQATTVPCPSAGFVTKVNPGGSGLAYSTYLRPTGTTGNCDSNAQSIAIDPSGNAYVSGYTRSPSFPVTTDAFQSSYAGGPVVGYDAFFTKLNATGTALVYSSYLGGNGEDTAAGVAVDPAGDAYVVGSTASSNFPTTSGSLQPVWGGGFTCAGFSNPDANACSDAFVTKFPLGGTFRVLQIAPSTGGNSGAFTATIFGSGFHAGLAVKLSGGGQPDIIASVVSIGPSALYVTATFNLAGASTVARDVVVTNADGTTIMLPQAFTIQQGAAPNLQIQKTGTITVPGRATQYTITVTNTGNVDSGSFTVGELVDPWFTFISSDPTPTSIAPLPCVFPPAAVIGTTSYNAMPEWDFPSLPSQASRSITYAVGLSPSFPVGAPVSGTACFGSQEAWEHMHELELACYTASVASCAIDGPLCIGLIEACDVGALAALNSELICHDYQEITRASADPNELTGPLGPGSPGWVSGQLPLSYAISFENESTATVPAQQVVVTDQLTANLSMSTLALTSISIPGVSVPIPPTFNPAVGLDEITTNVDLRPAQTLFVNIDAKLNPSTRVLTWKFTSIDPSTGQPPLDPMAGFLPPGADGGISFTIKPKQGLATGAQITNQGSVVFDANPPISTNTWSNTLDYTAPISRVTSFAGAYACTDFSVKWSGTDVGSGIRDFTIYVSDNGTPFTPWLTNTPATSATYHGQAQHLYTFYSIARDRTGNIEAPKTTAEATITATAACGGPPSLTGTASVQSVSGTAFTVALQVTNNGTIAANNIIVKKIVPRTLAGAGTVTLTSPTLPIAVGNLAAGASTTVTLTLTVPATVTGFALAETGTVQDAQAKTYGLTLGEEVSR